MHTFLHILNVLGVAFYISPLAIGGPFLWLYYKLRRWGEE